MKVNVVYIQVYAYYKHLAGYISLDKDFRQHCQNLGTNIVRSLLEVDDDWQLGNWTSRQVTKYGHTKIIKHAVVVLKDQMIFSAKKLSR